MKMLLAALAVSAALFATNAQAHENCGDKKTLGTVLGAGAGWALSNTPEGVVIGGVAGHLLGKGAARECREREYARHQNYPTREDIRRAHRRCEETYYSDRRYYYAEFESFMRGCVSQRIEVNSPRNVEHRRSYYR